MKPKTAQEAYEEAAEICDSYSDWRDWQEIPGITDAHTEAAAAARHLAKRIRSRALSRKRPSGN